MFTWGRSVFVHCNVSCNGLLILLMAISGVKQSPNGIICHFINRRLRRHFLSAQCAANACLDILRCFAYRIDCGLTPGILLSDYSGNTLSEYLSYLTPVTTVRRDFIANQFVAWEECETWSGLDLCRDNIPVVAALTADKHAATLAVILKYATYQVCKYVCPKFYLSCNLQSPYIHNTFSLRTCLSFTIAR